MSSKSMTDSDGSVTSSGISQVAARPLPEPKAKRAKQASTSARWAVHQEADWRGAVVKVSKDDTKARVVGTDARLPSGWVRTVELLRALRAIPLAGPMTDPEFKAVWDYAGEVGELFLEESEPGHFVVFENDRPVAHSYLTVEDVDNHGRHIGTRSRSDCLREISVYLDARMVLQMAARGTLYVSEGDAFWPRFERARNAAFVAMERARLDGRRTE